MVGLILWSLHQTAMAADWDLIRLYSAESASLKPSVETLGLLLKSLFCMSFLLRLLVV